MSEEKICKVSEEQYKKLQVMENTSKEDKERQREETIKTNEMRIVQFGRMVLDKEDQIKTSIFREKSDTYVDGVKPTHILQNEVEDIGAHMNALEFQIKNLKEAKDDKD